MADTHGTRRGGTPREHTPGTPDPSGEAPATYRPVARSYPSPHLTPDPYGYSPIATQERVQKAREALEHEAATTSGGRRRLPGEGARTIRVPHTYASVPQVRATLVQDLEGRGISDLVIEEAETVVSELVANAVNHAKPLTDGCVRIRWKVKAGAVEVEVSDGGSQLTPRPIPPSPWAPRGRGLRIVRSVAHEWGVQDNPNGRTVWAALGGPSRRRGSH